MTEVVFVALCAVMCLASFVMRQALIEASDHAAEFAREFRPIKRIPRVLEQEADSGRVLLRADAIGRPSVFFFFEPDEVGSRLRAEHILGSVAALWAKSRRNLFIVFMGEGDYPGVRPPFVPADGITIIMDRRRQMARRFKVRESPIAYQFDTLGYLISCGRMEVPVTGGAAAADWAEAAMGSPVPPSGRGPAYGESS